MKIKLEITMEDFDNGFVVEQAIQTLKEQFSKDYDYYEELVPPIGEVLAPFKESYVLSLSPKDDNE